jgi:hypothetical protein
VRVPGGIREQLIESRQRSANCLLGVASKFLNKIILGYLCDSEGQTNKPMGHQMKMLVPTVSF